MIVSNSNPIASAQPVNYSDDQDNDCNDDCNDNDDDDRGFNDNCDVYDHGYEVDKDKHTNRLKISTNLFQNPQLSKMPFRVSHF